MKANCPICDEKVPISKDIEETEILTCPECDNRLVVEKIRGNSVKLEEAPEIEEDWGE